jgi:gas vesicle protein
MPSHKSFMEFLAGLLVGTALGASAAVLLAPKTGRQMRESLAEEARRLAVKASRYGLDPSELYDVAASEAGRAVVKNIERIRSAGL